MVNVTLIYGAKRVNTNYDPDLSIEQIFADNNITLGNALVSLDGATVRNVGSTLRSLGYDGTPGHDQAHLSGIVKADNACTVKIVGGAAILESAYSADDYAKAAKFNRESTALYQGDGENRKEVFRVTVGEGHGTVGQYGIKFAETKNGKAIVTALLPQGVQDPKKWVAEEWGAAMLQLDKVESGMQAALEAALTNARTIDEHIVLA